MNYGIFVVIAAFIVGLAIINNMNNGKPRRL